MTTSNIPPGPVSWALTSAAVGMVRDRIASACRAESRTSTIRDVRMSDAVEWSIHCCTLLAALPEDQALPAARLAEYHDVPPAYLAKALQALAAAGIVESRPGPRRWLPARPLPMEIRCWRSCRRSTARASAFRCSEIRQRGPGAIDEPGAYRALRHRRAMWRAEDAWRAELRQDDGRRHGRRLRHQRLAGAGADAGSSGCKRSTYSEGAGHEGVRCWCHGRARARHDPALVAAGHEVRGAARSPEKADQLRAKGRSPSASTCSMPRRCAPPSTAARASCTWPPTSRC